MSVSEQIGLGVIMYADEWDRKLPHWNWGDDPTSGWNPAQSEFEGHYLMWLEGYVPEKLTFHCPTHPSAWEGSGDRAALDGWGGSSLSGSGKSDYCYLAPLPQLVQGPGESDNFYWRGLAITSDDWYSPDPEPPERNHGNFYNVLYFDGTVKAYPDVLAGNQVITFGNMAAGGGLASAHSRLESWWADVITW